MSARLRPVLAPGHVALVSALARSAELKRRVVARTPALAAGLEVEVGERRVRVGGRLGEGMMAVTYAAECLATGARLALKRARAPFGLLRQVLAAEAEASRLLPGWGGPRTARVVAADADHLLKELHAGPTLARLVAEGVLDARRRAALEEVLASGARVLVERGFLADLSPKNLVWEEEPGGGWVLLDTGQPLVRTGFAPLLGAGADWEAYLGYFGERIEAGRSRPSALAPGAAPGDLDPRRARRHAFLHTWWTWLPYDDAPPADRVLAEVDPAAVEEEVLLLAEGEGARRRLREAPWADPAAVAAARDRARAEWRALYPELELSD